MKTCFAPLAALLVLCGCATNAEDFARRPRMTPVGSGLLASSPDPGSGPPARAPRLETGSLWSDRSADLFKDPRARRVGDTLTIKISIKDRASIDSASDRSRSASRDSGASFAYDIATRFATGSGTGNLSTNANTDSTHEGKGGTSREEKIDLLLAAVVTDRLPNGNLTIRGSQEVRVNFEIRELKVAGIVRPRDIGPDNSISYDKIAEARISYGGRGRIMEIQQPAWGQQLLDLIAPF